MMFHFAPPEEKGLGVITSTPGLVRSSQSLMFLGLPFLTTRATTESVIMPLYSFLFQLGSTSLSSTNLVMSGSSENATTSAGCPASTARLWSPDGPYDEVNVTPLPAFVSAKIGVSSS